MTGPGGERRLEMPRAKVFVLYADGFEVDDGPFRGFDDARNRDFVVDLRDGYFPYEMKETHPDGVPFTLVDRSSEEYSKRREKTRQKKTGGDRKCGKSFEAFTGGGARLDGGAVTEGRRRRAPPRFRNVSEEKVSRGWRSRGGFFPLQGRRFSGENPPRRRSRRARDRGQERPGARDGGISRRRGFRGIRRASASRRVLETTVSRGCFRRLLRGGPGALVVGPRGWSREPPLETATLRVKGVDGGKMYVLTLHPDDTVGKLRRYLAEALRGEEAGASSRAFEPLDASRRLFDDDRTTLREARARAERHAPAPRGVRPTEGLVGRGARRQTLGGDGASSDALGRDVKSLSRVSRAPPDVRVVYHKKSHREVPYRLLYALPAAGHCTVAEHCVHMSECPTVSTTCTGLSMQILHPLSPRAAPR